MKKDEKIYMNNLLENYACNYVRNYYKQALKEIIKKIDNQKMLDSFKNMLNRDITYNEFLELLRIFKKFIKINYQVETNRMKQFEAV